MGDLKLGIANMINFMIFCDNEEIEIERTAYTLIDILSVVGGFSSLMNMLGKIFAKIYSPS